MHRNLLNTCAVALVLGATFIASGKAVADQVIPDDLIVQGSACVGLDCVNNEPFGFDTIRLKENNTRILFMDTSTSPGFPFHQWQLTANDSASGGLNKFSIENITLATVPVTVVAAAPTNSLFVATSGKVGLRTSTPLLDLHVATGNTPAFRLEQNTSGGFTAQTWDIGSNEANFFVRDLTGGSRLPLRIRPGAPTSSIDVAASGNVGVGTASPGVKLHVVGAAGLGNSDSTNRVDLRNSGVTGAGNAAFAIDTAVANAMVISSAGNVGIGATTPAAQLHTTGTVRFAGVTGCGGGIVSNGSGDLSCMVSSRQFKNIAGDLASNVALANVMALRPQTGSYKETPDVPEHWLIAEEVAAVDPALIGLNDGKPYVVKTQNIVADLVAVVQQQQRQIEELKRLVSAK
jgi:hypothetical protein